MSDLKFIDLIGLVENIISYSVLDAKIPFFQIDDVHKNYEIIAIEFQNVDVAWKLWNEPNLTLNVFERIEKCKEGRKDHFVPGRI